MFDNADHKANTTRSVQEKERYVAKRVDSKAQKKVKRGKINEVFFVSHLLLVTVYRSIYCDVEL